MREAIHHHRADAADGAGALGRHEPFSRDKAIAGVRKARKGRPVTEDASPPRPTGQRHPPRGWERQIAATRSAWPSSPLKALDEVAYLRFASVYKKFGSVGDFADEIASLMAADADTNSSKPLG